MGQYKKLWYALIAVLTITFSILGYFRRRGLPQRPRLSRSNMFPFPAKC